eukprot:Phypoly_transcript_01520.p1 GENE.Phypoly_transcript_01520~~Phypoly_transcript_01520.p1  ORF type:complete len:881 (+),score=159.98 Phypoly_transcript_01520:575-3217(+)
MVCSVTFGLFSILDYIYFHHPVTFFLQIAIGIFMLVAFGVTLCPTAYVRIHNILVTSCVIVLVGGMLGLNMMRRDGYTFRELVPLVIIPHTLHHYLRLNFVYTTFVCFITQAWYSVSMPLFYGIHYEFITVNAFVLVSSLIAISTNYSLERRNKMDFLRACEQTSQEKDSSPEEAYRSKGLLLANMTQELITPIRGICGHAQLLYNTPLHETQYFHIKVMRECSQLLLSLTDNIMQMSKMDEEIKLEEGLINLCDIVEQAVRVIAEPASSKRLKMSSYVSSRIPDCVVGDASKVLQILVNLLGNAVKFTTQGSVHVSLSVELETESKYTVSLKVKDTGSGIEAEAIPHLYKWFCQSSNTISQGAAVGLILVNQLANIMGGQLDVSSLHGSGSVFRVTLNFPKYYLPGPSSPPPDLPPGEIDPTGTFTHWPMREGVTPLQVLVVDSSEDSRAAVCSYLRDSSPRLCVDANSRSRELVEFCVVSVSSPEAALHILSQYRISVVIINDWLDQNFSQLLLELEANLSLAKIQLIYACQERSPYLEKLQELDPRCMLLRLPLRRESLLKSVFHAADSSLFASLTFPDDAARQRSSDDTKANATTINMELVEYYMHSNASNKASFSASLSSRQTSTQGTLSVLKNSSTSVQRESSNNSCSLREDPEKVRICREDSNTSNTRSTQPDSYTRRDDTDGSYAHRDDTDGSFAHRDDSADSYHAVVRDVQRDMSSTFSSLADASFSLKLHHISTPTHRETYLDTSSDFSTSNLYSSEVGSYPVKPAIHIPTAESYKTMREIYISMDDINDSNTSGNENCESLTSGSANNTSEDEKSASMDEKNTSIVENIPENSQISDGKAPKSAVCMFEDSLPISPRSVYENEPIHSAA